MVYSLFEDIRSPSENRLAKPVVSYTQIKEEIFTAKSADPFNRPFHRGIFIKPAVFSNNNPTVESVHIESKPLPAGFLDKDEYQFQVTINPTKRDNISRKLVPIRGRFVQLRV